jgi:hypothetical protein
VRHPVDQLEADRATLRRLLEPKERDDAVDVDGEDGAVYQR